MVAWPFIIHESLGKSWTFLFLSFSIYKIVVIATIPPPESSYEHLMEYWHDAWDMVSGQTMFFVFIGF